VVKSAEGKSRCVVIDRIETSKLAGPADLQRRITASVGLWCRKLQESGFVPPAKVARKFYELDDARLVQSDSHGQQSFPWGPVTPPAQQPFNPLFPPAGPATPAPTPAPVASPLGTLLISLLGGMGGGGLLTLAFTLWGVYRDVRKAKGEQLLLSDEVFNRLADAFAKRQQQNVQ
jgi:hypothetical protein